jgi:cell division septation protein DedD
MPTTPLTEKESKELLQLEEAAKIAAEESDLASAAFSAAQSKFLRVNKRLRIEHGAGPDVDWDPIQKEWVKAPPQQGQPVQVPVEQPKPHPAAKPPKPKKKARTKRGKK